MKNYGKFECNKNGWQLLQIVLNENVPFYEYTISQEIAIQSIDGHLQLT